MKNLLVANFQPPADSGNDKKKGMDINGLKLFINAQIDNSLHLGWDPKDIILVTNFMHHYNGINAFVTNLNSSCLTGSKMFTIKWLYENNIIDDTIWAHDLDAWQNDPFYEPEFKDVGVSTYSRPKFNGGSIFIKPSALDIINEIINNIITNNEDREEPTINEILKSNKYKDRVTVLNNTYNVGCSGYKERYERSSKPIKVCHFNPLNRLAWWTFVGDRHKLGQAASDRLASLLTKKFGKYQSFRSVPYTMDERDFK